MEYARRLFDSGKLKMGSFALPLEWDTDDETFAKDLAKLPDYAQAAVAAGCTRRIATVVPATDKRPYHENFEFHKRRFQEICRALEPSGVRFGVGFQAAEYLQKTRHSSSCTIWTPHAPAEHGGGAEHRPAAGHLGRRRRRRFAR